MKTKSLLLGLFCCCCISAEAQVLLNKGAGKNSFPIVSPSSKAVVCVDGKDEIVVRKSVSLFVEDVNRVAGQTLEIAEKEPGDVSARYAIIVGTIGESEWINKLAARNKIDTTSIAGGWERYLIEKVSNPVPGIKNAIVIAGSDRRGTAYGLLSISRAIGVSPWYWWADAPVKQLKQLNVNVNKYISNEPTVKFRGIFINDEDWGLYKWSKENFEKERGNFGPRTYAKVCELLLRLQANYLCPAMHDASMAFHRIPENRLVADSFAIVMGSSHCEPLLFNSASEWKRDKMGEWDYINNKTGVDKVLKSRVEECAPFENVYTLALRGLHDKAMNASNDMSDRKKMLQEALMAQRQMLVDVIGKRAEDIQVLHVEDLTILGDYFIIANGTSTTHTRTLADEVEYQMTQKGREPGHREGRGNGSNWVVLDYADIIVHIFYKETRDFYQLERLWADGEQVDISQWIKTENGAC